MNRLTVDPHLSKDYISHRSRLTLPFPCLVNHHPFTCNIHHYCLHYAFPAIYDA